MRKDIGLPLVEKVLTMFGFHLYSSKNTNLSLHLQWKIKGAEIALNYSDRMAGFSMTCKNDVDLIGLPLSGRRLFLIDSLA